METGIGLETPDIDAVHADLKARGADVDDEVSRMGDPVPPLFWLRDPDGNSLMVVEVA
jgi:catechol 2,3-dioxygenase-like lactoylglutathione lyase family enzyme